MVQLYYQKLNGEAEMRKIIMLVVGSFLAAFGAGSLHDGLTGMTDNFEVGFGVFLLILAAYLLKGVFWSSEG